MISSRSFLDEDGQNAHAIVWNYCHQRTPKNCCAFYCNIWPIFMKSTCRNDYLHQYSIEFSWPYSCQDDLPLSFFSNKKAIVSCVCGTAIPLLVACPIENKFFFSKGMYKTFPIVCLYHRPLSKHMTSMAPTLWSHSYWLLAMVTRQVPGSIFLMLVNQLLWFVMCSVALVSHTKFQNYSIFHYLHQLQVRRW